MESRRVRTTSRRGFLAGVATVGTLSVAGCLGGLSDAGRRPLEDNPVGRGLADRPRRGPSHEETPITLVEFTDPSCSYCASFYENAFQEIDAEWVETGEATVYNRFRPTVAEWGELAMHALLEAYERDPSLYWKLKAGYFARRDELSESTIATVTQDLLSAADVDADAVTAAIDEAAHEATIEADAAAADDAGVDGVPTTLVFVDGAFASALNDEDFGAFEAAVEEQ